MEHSNSIRNSSHNSCILHWGDMKAKSTKQGNLTVRHSYLGSVLNKVKHCGHLGYKAFTQLDESGVCVSDYASGVWGLREYTSCNDVHHRAIRFFLGANTLTPVLAINGDMGWGPPNIRHKCQMIRLWNRFVKMSDQRLTKKIFN